MDNSRRVFIIVLDSVGAGEMPDAADYGDLGSNTLGNTATAVGGFDLPCLEAMGLGNIIDIKGVSRTDRPLASWGRMSEISKGKDTITGHWEMMGIVNTKPFPLYPEGFPPDVIDEFRRRTGRGVLANRPASGTEIIKEFGDEHMRTGDLIVYTSGDSVFQIAAHEEVVGVEELYNICRIARDILRPPHNVCRVIARPFIGPPYERTYRRKDFPLPPPHETVLDHAKAAGHRVISVGKVMDMFDGHGFHEIIKYAGNAEGMSRIRELMETLDAGLVFANLVDFDTQYGHRNDPAGYYCAIKEFDTWLADAIGLFSERDYLFITADHGCDPTTPSTDHSREYVPILFYHKGEEGRDLGVREGFWDLGATVAWILGVRDMGGKSFI